ncbi:MAG TPA: STAS domain-containing protein [Oxalicibacterium sp.]|nr:STAS domain-containing protein [Oxalicibacterium sp.]
MFQPGTSLTFDNASSVLRAGLQAIAGGQAVIDFTDVKAADSSAVATLLAWQRAAQAHAVPLAFANLPDNLRSLIALYDVSALLVTGSSAASFPRSDLPHH